LDSECSDADENTAPCPALTLTDYAEMERVAVGDRGTLAHYTDAILRENGLSYREQEEITGISGALVYRMANGGQVSADDVRRFARTAARMTVRVDAGLFWARLENRLSHLLGSLDEDGVSPRRAA
jgi:hypothetical protein